MTTTSRADRVAEAQRLRAEGLLLREIAERMGSKVPTVSAWLNDPDLSRHQARRAAYRGTCIDCGAPTDGSDGPGKARERCNPCASHFRRRWTCEAIVAAIQAWSQEHGRPPRATDWNSTLARGLGRPARGSEYPNASTVQAVFGAWASAIEAAGFDRPRSGVYDRRSAA